MDFLSKIGRKWQFIVYFSLIATALAFIASVALPPKYRAESSIIIIQKDTEVLSASKSIGFLTGIFAKIAHTDSFIEEVLRSSSLIEEFPKDPYERKRTWKKAVKIEELSNIGILEVKAYGKTKENAVLLIGLIGESYLRKVGDYHGFQDRIELKIIDGPIASSFPVSPNVLASSLTGLIGGFLVAIFIVLIFDDFNLKIFKYDRHNVEKIEKLVKDQVEKQVSWKLAKKEDLKNELIKTGESLNRKQEDDYFGVTNSFESFENKEVSEVSEGDDLKIDHLPNINNQTDQDTQEIQNQNQEDQEVQQPAQEVQEVVEREVDSDSNIKTDSETEIPDHRKYDEIPIYKTPLRRNVEKVIGDSNELRKENIQGVPHEFEVFQNEIFEKDTEAGIVKEDHQKPFEEELVGDLEDNIEKTDIYQQQEKDRQFLIHSDKECFTKEVLSEKSKKDEKIQEQEVDEKPEFSFDPSLLSKLKNKVENINKKSGFDQESEKGEDRTSLRVEQPEKPIFKSNNYEEFKREYVPPKEVFVGRPSQDDKEIKANPKKMNGYGLTSEGVVEYLRAEVRRAQKNKYNTYWKDGVFIERYKTTEDEIVKNKLIQEEPSDQEVKDRLNRLLRGEA